ncbi:hypothetical protein R1sor_006522 [Riccia sorocarpa]|uniref:Uncharacterized protein n=1 Tax=Riccia sorocarpa TaxID=122646 RepID=A0ABD3HPX5_9MARC
MDMGESKVRYELDGVVTRFLMLGELTALNTSQKSFSTTQVSEHLGRVGIIPKNWTELELDWYLPRVELATFRKLFKGKETLDGPFKCISGDSKLVLLEDCEGQQFEHPKFFTRKEGGKKLYRSTAAWVWSSRCLCENRNESLSALPVTCFSGEVFGLLFCLKCGAGTGIHDHPECSQDHPVNNISEEESQEYTKIEEVLSQNVCLCEEPFDSNHVCFCGYKPGTEHEGGSESQEVHAQREGQGSVQGRDSRREHEATETARTEEENTKDDAPESQEGYKNRLELTPNNIMGCALQYRKYRAQKPLSISFRGCLRQMLSTGKYIPAFKWLSMPAMSRLRAELMWKSCIAHELVSIRDVDNIFFGTTDSPRYFEENNKPLLFMPNVEPTEEDADLPQQEVHGEQKRENNVPEKTFVTGKAGSQGTAVKEEPTSDPDPDDSEEDLDVVELEDVAPAGTDLQQLLSDLLFAGFNVATKRTREDEGTSKPDEDRQSNVVDLQDLLAEPEMGHLLGDLLFAGYTVAKKGTTVAKDQKKEDFVLAYILLCRSSAAGGTCRTCRRGSKPITAYLQYMLRRISFAA